MTTTPTRQRRVAAAAVVDDLRMPRRLLAARRTAPAHLAGLWELPGGKVEPGEAPAGAVHRELSEELGIAILLGERADGPLDGLWPLAPGWLMHLWWAEISEGDPHPLQDHDALRWVSREQVPTLTWLPSNAAITAYLAASMHGS
ncbi:MAG: (deoxy)nucleoside triphosphate pyrophosphohydrolase [Ornithinimicrobium sp.]